MIVANPNTQFLQQLIQNTRNSLTKFQHFKEHGAEVTGVVIASQRIFDRAESEEGFEVVYQYTTLDGHELTGNDRTTIHFPQRDVWEAYARSRQVGAAVRVIYDPRGIYLPLTIFSDENMSIDRVIDTLHAQLHSLLEQLEKLD
jgi:hypothetical protein